MPLDIIDLVDDARGRMKEDYSSKELTLAVGDIVRGSKVLSGWVWAERVGTGEYGWVPMNALEVINHLLQVD